MGKLRIRDADRFYGEPLARFDAMANSDNAEAVDAVHFKMWCRIAADEIRHARELQANAETNCRHWREECGKLHARIRTEDPGRAALSSGKEG